MTIQEIVALPKIVRLAGYLKKLAALDECGARLRVAHQKEATDHDEGWSSEEELEWERLGDELDPWFYSLSDEERELLSPVENFMACLCRGEDPAEHIRLRTEFLPAGKYGKRHETDDLQRRESS